MKEKRITFDEMDKIRIALTGEYESAWEWIKQREKDWTNSNKSEKEKERFIKNMETDIEDYFRITDGMKEMFRILVEDESQRNLVDKMIYNYGLALRDLIERTKNFAL